MRAFTVDEANALLPSVERILARLDTLTAEIVSRRDRLQVLELIWGDRLADAFLPDAAEAVSLKRELETRFVEVRQLIHEEIITAGIRLPMGGLEHGLVDFPTTWQGRYVMLCWQRGEPEVLAWHEMDGGFAGRQTLTPEQVRRMGREQLAEPLDWEDGPEA